MTASEQLRAGLAYLETHGWVQGPTFLTSDGGSGDCAYLALYHAVGKNESSYSYLLRLIGVSLLGDFFDWNDAPVRTKEEVIALYHRAIALAEADEAPVMDPIDVEFNAMFVPEEVMA